MRQFNKAFLVLRAVLALPMVSVPVGAWGKTPKCGKLLYMTLCKGSALSGHAPEGHQMGHAGRGLSCVFAAANPSS